MAGQASVALENISSHSGVLLVRLRAVMACRAGEYRIIIGVGMTVRALIPGAFMGTTVDWEKLLIMIAVFCR